MFVAYYPIKAEISPVRINAHSIYILYCSAYKHEHRSRISNASNAIERQPHGEALTLKYDKPKSPNSSTLSLCSSHSNSNLQAVQVDPLDGDLKEESSEK